MKMKISKTTYPDKGTIPNQITETKIARIENSQTIDIQIVTTTTIENLMQANLILTNFNLTKS